MTKVCRSCEVGAPELVPSTGRILCFVARDEEFWLEPLAPVILFCVVGVGKGAMWFKETNIIQLERNIEYYKITVAKFDSIHTFFCQAYLFVASIIIKKYCSRL